MVATGEIRKRVLRAIDESRHAAVTRRARAEEAERDGTAVLTDVITPLFKTVAAALKAEGYGFRVVTPPGSVRLASEVSSEDFIEVTLDTLRDPPALVGRVSRTWGRRVLVDELMVREASAIRTLTGDDALEFVLGQLGPFVER